jgi:hypothetical protein
VHGCSACSGHGTFVDRGGPESSLVSLRNLPQLFGGHPHPPYRGHEENGHRGHQYSQHNHHGHIGDDNLTQVAVCVFQDLHHDRSGAREKQRCPLCSAVRVALLSHRVQCGGIRAFMQESAKACSGIDPGRIGGSNCFAPPSDIGPLFVALVCLVWDRL